MDTTANTKKPRRAAVSSPNALRQIVPGLISEGLTVLEGSEKVGKSWLALDFALAVATGGLAMGSVRCEEGDVIYVDYENGEFRLRARLDELAPGGSHEHDWRADLPRLRWYAFELPQLRLTEVLDVWRSKAKEPRLVVIDAGSHFTQAAGYSWRMDHASRDGMLRAFRGVHGWALDNRVGVLCVARTSKGGAGAATKRHFGIADAVLTMERRGASHALRVAGRDVAEHTMLLAFDGSRFRLTGDSRKAGRWGHRSRILELIAAKGGAAGPSEVAVALGLPVANVAKMMFRMAAAGELARLRLGRYGIAEQGRNPLGQDHATPEPQRRPARIRPEQALPARAPGDGNCGAETRYWEQF
jgi:hypothetical protein